MGIFKKQDKAEKPTTIAGHYYGSHPDIKGYDILGIDFYQDGVVIHNGLRKKKRENIKRFGWDEIVGFKTDVQKDTQMHVTHKLIRTRTSGRINENFIDALDTTTGSIEIETRMDSGNLGASTAGNIGRSGTELLIMMRKTKVEKIRKLVGSKVK